MRKQLCRGSRRIETDIPLPNVAHMQTRPARPDRNEVDLRQLVAGFFRMAPDVAIVGEVGDRKGLYLFLSARGRAGFLRSDDDGATSPEVPAVRCEDREWA